MLRLVQLFSKYIFVFRLLFAQLMMCCACHVYVVQYLQFKLCSCLSYMFSVMCFVINKSVSFFQSSVIFFMSGHFIDDYTVLLKTERLLTTTSFERWQIFVSLSIIHHISLFLYTHTCAVECSRNKVNDYLFYYCSYSLASMLTIYHHIKFFHVTRIFNPVNHSGITFFVC